MLIYNRADIALITSQAAFQRGERYHEQALADALFDAAGSASLPSDDEQLLALLTG